MISNNICKNCNHVLVCSKQTTLEKIDSESKKFIDKACPHTRDFSHELGRV